MNYETINFEGHKVKKCIGEGQSSCRDCLRETGFSREWTSFCYLDNNEVVCRDHLIRRLDKDRIKTFGLKELAKAMGLRIGDKIRVYHSTDRNIKIKPYTYILNDQYYMAPADDTTQMLGNGLYLLNYYVGCEYAILERGEN